MRYLRLYKNDTDFKTQEQEAGGTGNAVESIVPGIVKTVDERKMYFNPHDKDIEFFTITINYKDNSGFTIAGSDTVRVKYVSGVSQEIVLTPKYIDGYAPVNSKNVVTIPDENNVVFEYEIVDCSKIPLTFNIISAGTISWVARTQSFTSTIQYKVNNGDWTNITSNTGSTAPHISLNAGDSVKFRGNHEKYGTTNQDYNKFSGTGNIKFNVCGNIMSLIDSTGYAETKVLTGGHNFHGLFENNAGLISAENLLLPATGLAYNCYSYMFYGCSGLTTAPELPAATLAFGCYQAMFVSCTSLTTAPELPATRLADYCYESMFSGCISLTTVHDLPATTLTWNCYQYMFSNCTSLTTAPELPAAKIGPYSYYHLFNGCTNLNYIKCLATDKSDTYCTFGWVYGVASAGTFVKDPNMSTNVWGRGDNGIPYNWEIEDAS